MPTCTRISNFILLSCITFATSKSSVATTSTQSLQSQPLEHENTYGLHTTNLDNSNPLHSPVIVDSRQLVTSAKRTRTHNRSIHTGQQHQTIRNYGYAPPYSKSAKSYSAKSSKSIKSGKKSNAGYGYYNGVGGSTNYSSGKSSKTQLGASNPQTPTDATLTKSAKAAVLLDHFSLDHHLGGIVIQGSKSEKKSSEGMNHHVGGIVIAGNEDHEGEGEGNGGGSGSGGGSDGLDENNIDDTSDIDDDDDDDSMTDDNLVVIVTSPPVSTPDLRPAIVDIDNGGSDGDSDSNTDESDGGGGLDGGNDSNTDGTEDNGTTSNDPSDNNETNTTEDSSSSTNPIPPYTLSQRKSIITSKCKTTIHSRSNALLKLLSTYVSQPETTLISQEGPMYNAYVWLVHIDDAILCPPIDAPPGQGDIDAVYRIVQRYTLAALYYSMNGSEWNNCSAGTNFYDDESEEVKRNAGEGDGGKCSKQDGTLAIPFLDSKHECTWYGISCNTAPNIFDWRNYVDVDAYHPITSIELSNTNLVGEVPIEVYRVFDKLKVLDMESNGIGGTLSEDVGRLVGLEVLKL